MEDFELTKKPDLGIFDRRFPAIFDDPMYDPTKMTIIQGTDGVLDDLFSYQVYNKLKNHWRLDVEPADRQVGMIWSESGGNDKLYHYGEVGGDAWEEILQLTRSADVTPEFTGLLLAGDITHVDDADTYIRFQDDQMLLYVGGVAFINMVEAATPYLALLAGKVLIGDNLNAEMTQGLTINQADNDDEILALKSSDVAHGVTTHAETDTYALMKKDAGDTGGLQFWAFSEANRAMILVPVCTTDNTDKDATALAPFIVDVYKRSVTTADSVGADANLVVFQNASVTKWLVDEDGDTWQNGEITCASISPLILGVPTELTIAGGAITVTRGYHTVDAAAAANLDTINGGVDGMELTLRAESAARTITVRDAQDNIELEGGVNMVLDGILKKLYLLYDDGTVPRWVERGRFNG